MATETITMPRLGESVTEGTVARWRVKVGERIDQFAPLLEVDTDKVSAEIPSPLSGVVVQILAREGETVLVGAPIAVVDVEPTAETSAPSAGAGQKTPATLADTGTASTEFGFVSPAVSRLAAEHGIELARLRGSGAAGRVTKTDIQREIAARATRAVPASTTPGDTVVPLTRIRRLIAENVTRSKTTIPHAWQAQEVDMSGVVANRRANKDRVLREHGAPLTYVAYVVAAAAAALREVPQVNATFGGNEIVLRGAIHIGISVGLDDAVVVPVIRRADEMSIDGLATQISSLSDRARAQRLSPDDLIGATFTVNNSGTFGTVFSYSVISPGQAGILTMEAIVDRPVAVDGQVAIRPMMYLCFSLDHRVMDGLTAARFLTKCRVWLEAITEATPLHQAPTPR